MVVKEREREGEGEWEQCSELSLSFSLVELISES